MLYDHSLTDCPTVAHNDRDLYTNFVYPCSIYSGPAVVYTHFEPFGPAVAILQNTQNKYTMHYKMIIKDYPETLYKPTELLLQGKRYHYTGFILEDQLVWNLMVYSIRERKRCALDILYSEYYIDSIVISDEAIVNAALPGWQYI